MIKELVLGKKYRIIGDVCESHGDCKGDVIELVGYDWDGDPLFDGLSWDKPFQDKGCYILVHHEPIPDNMEYIDWVKSVLEEIE